MSRPRHSRVDGIVLRARNMGEADRVFTLFTRERGKIDAVAKGVRRGRNPFSGRLEFMNEVVLELHHGRTLDVMTAVDVTASHFDVIVAPDAFAAASLVAEYVDAACQPEEPSPEIFLLLSGVLGAFHGQSNPMRFLPRFELRLLYALGFGPQFDYCVRCNRSLGACAELWLDVEDGGLACGVCRSHLAGVLELAREDVENLRALSRPLGSPLPPTLSARPLVLVAIERLMVHHLGHRPRVRAALDILRDLPVA
jgi:DNA repair protein RecO (recombination protein O)